MFDNEENGQYVSYDGKLYRSPWMRPTISEHNFIEADIVEITEDQYNIYIKAINNNEIIDNDENDDEEEPIIEPIPVEPDAALEFVRESKIKEMSYTCRNTIESGFDLVLRGETRHFSLTTQDQLNLMSLSSMTRTQSLIPYHADGEESTFYTAEEMNQIIAAATSFKNYNLSYYNALKAYINSLDTIEAIAAITYGTPIPDEYKSDVLMVLE